LARKCHILARKCHSEEVGERFSIPAEQFWGRAAQASGDLKSRGTPALFLPRLSSWPNGEITEDQLPSFQMNAEAQHNGSIEAKRDTRFGRRCGTAACFSGPRSPRKTFYFGQYQGFRQVLGTTQVLPVPTADERAGRDIATFQGDTLFVPVDPGIARVLARYPLPNFPSGPYGARTYATSAKVNTDADQFSIRLDHKADQKSQLFFGVNFDNLIGPTTNPDQTVIDPGFGVRYIDQQRNLAVSYARTISSRFNLRAA